MSKRITIRADDALDAALLAHQNQHRLSRSAAVKQLLVFALESQGESQQEPSQPPPPPPSEPSRTSKKTVYFRAAELAIVREKARRYGLPISPFLRRLALGHQLPVAIPEVSLLLTELHREGNNLNQLARAINVARMGGRPMPDGEQLLQQISRLQELVGQVAAPILESLRGSRIRRPTRKRARSTAR